MTDKTTLAGPSMKSLRLGLLNNFIDSQSKFSDRVDEQVGELITSLGALRNKNKKLNTFLSKHKESINSYFGTYDSTNYICMTRVYLSENNFGTDRENERCLTMQHLVFSSKHKGEVEGVFVTIGFHALDRYIERGIKFMEKPSTITKLLTTEIKTIDFWGHIWGDLLNASNMEVLVSIPIPTSSGMFIARKNTVNYVVGIRTFYDNAMLEKKGLLETKNKLYELGKPYSKSQLTYFYQMVSIATDQVVNQVLLSTFSKIILDNLSNIDALLAMDMETEERKSANKHIVKSVVSNTQKYYNQYTRLDDDKIQEINVLISRKGVEKCLAGIRKIGFGNWTPPQPNKLSKAIHQTSKKV